LSDKELFPPTRLRQHLRDLQSINVHFKLQIQQLIKHQYAVRHMKIIHVQRVLCDLVKHTRHTNLLITEFTEHVWNWPITSDKKLCQKQSTICEHKL